MKNLVDWISRVNPNPLNFKAVGIVSAAGGPGGMRSQDDLRKTLIYLNPIVMNTPEVCIGANYLKFDSDNKLTDDGAIQLVTKFMAAFVNWITFVKKGTA